MPEILILILILFASLALAAWAFGRARHLYDRIEERHPGFNARMQAPRRSRRP